ncbi:MAG: phosphoribosylanthranilate isomerase [Candidatus Omnitrophica bacterium]|jgi:phosphoribosylanthranilate isomerase|nr:phosphoribosylanthranilate isomerase [Candidatus Omnitrophota bacterium]MDD5079836.1 phosphoribosylanthranilate isomerase [Candidatus Omnitrophota bacterium]
MVKVKICGITDLKDGLAAIEAGCDALGFVFFRKSKRYVTEKKAKAIIAGLGADIIKVGVFVNAREDRIRRIARSCRLDMLQFHGNEAPQFCARFKGHKVIKAFGVKGEMDFAGIEKYKTFARLFDSISGSRMGGGGKKFDWRHLSGQGQLSKKTVFLSGGLDERNVRKAINIVRPEWVDVSSAVEKTPGRKDPAKMRRFIRMAKG